MQGLTIQVFDPNAVFPPKIPSSDHRGATQRTLKESTRFERLLEKASRTQEASKEPYRAEKKTLFRKTDAQTRDVGRESPRSCGRNAEGSGVGRPESVRDGAGNERVGNDAPVRSGSTPAERASDSVRDTKVDDDGIGNDGAKTGITFKVHTNETGGGLKIKIVGLPKDLLEEILPILSERIEALFSVAGGLGGGARLVEAINLVSDPDGSEPCSDSALDVHVNGGLDAAELVRQLESLLADIGSLFGGMEIHEAVVKIQVINTRPSQAPVSEEASSSELPAPKAWSHLMVQFREAHGETGPTVRTGAQVQTSLAAVLSEDLLLQPGSQPIEQIDVSPFAKLRIAGASETVFVYKGKESILAEQHVGDFESSTSFAEHGAPTPAATVTSGSPAPDGARSTSFSTIVADRIAAIAEQMAMKEKQVDVLLRLQTEEGASVLVNMREQAGKILVNVRSGDERIINLLQSEKETIVRHLEEKQVAVAISVSPIGEEDLPRRESREQMRRHWARQAKPFNPSVEASA